MECLFPDGGNGEKRQYSQRRDCCGHGQHEDHYASGSHMNRERQTGQGRGTTQFDAQWRRTGQRRENISVPFVPPNPKEFESAVRMTILRAVFGT